jgi:hypothetical protein
MSASNDMARLTLLSHYAKIDERTGKFEEWNDIVRRVFDMHRKRMVEIGTSECKELASLFTFSEKQCEEMFCLPSGRSLQFGSGEKILSKHARIYNCSATLCDRPRVFQELFFLLLCGCGTGLSVVKSHVSKLPAIGQRAEPPIKIFCIPDTIEGWADAVGVLMSTFFIGIDVPFPNFTGHRVVFDYSQIRPKGAKISGITGLAPGAEPLRKTLESVTSVFMRLLARNATRLDATDCFDIIGHISDSVLSAGCRRSACLLLGSPDDDRFLSSKTGNWYTENAQRARANISVLVNRKDLDIGLMTKFVDLAKNFGEPGLILNDGDDRFIVNPCVPIDTRVHTSNGVFSVSDLLGVQFHATIEGVSYPSTSHGFVHTGYKTVFQVITTIGYRFKATANHLVLTESGAWCTVEDLKIGQAILLSPMPVPDIDCLSENFRLGQRMALCLTAANDRLLTASNDTKAGFCRGFFDQCDEHMYLLQELLLDLGICSTLEKGKLAIHDTEVLQYIMGHLLVKPVREPKNVTLYVKSIVLVGNMNVYDCCIPEKHAFTANGIIVHNCAEIGMLPVVHKDDFPLAGITHEETGWQFCNLTEIAVANCYDVEKRPDTALIRFFCPGFESSDFTAGRTQFLNACIGATFIACVQATYTTFEYLGINSELITRREALTGVSQTSIFDLEDPNNHLDPVFQAFAAKLCRSVAKYSSKLLGIREPARVTTIKPAGTSTTILGRIGSGIHLGHAPCYIRHIQATSTDPLAKFFHAHRPQSVEVSAWSENTLCLAFPIETQAKKTKVNTGALELLDYAVSMQKSWVGGGRISELGRIPELSHNVSLTLNVADWEWALLPLRILANKDHITGISMLGCSGDVIYRQAPFMRAKTAQELVNEYGVATLFASGLIVDIKAAFGGSLHSAVDAVKYGVSLTEERKTQVLDRVVKFATNFFEKDIDRCLLALLEVDALHKFTRVQREQINNPIDWSSFVLNEEVTIRERNRLQAEHALEPSCTSGACELVRV